MIRKILIFTVLAVTAVAAVVLPLWKSDAAQQRTSIGSPKRPAGRGLPNFDIRLTGRGEFDDMDLSSSSGKQAAMQNALTRARVSGVDQFRSSLPAEHAKNLRAVINEAGAMKSLFIEGAALSEPRSDTADNIARNFLERHDSLFALPGANNEELKLENEDNDRGTTFLSYTQTVDGLKVFGGQVQVVVNKNGEVLNVREGFLVDGPPLKRTGAMNEAKAIAKAFEHAGRTVFQSFVENYSRASSTEASRFANPLDLNFEEVLSEQNVVRINGESRLAWHIYAEVGPEEWYEILLDAYSGELLLRHNLYVHQAQGTVYTEAPDKGPRQLVSFVGDTTINTAAGWMGTSTVTTGNNVDAYLDRDANNAPDNINGFGLLNGRASAPDQNFTFPFDPTVDPRIQTQLAAIVTNLFYYNNIMHDFSYNLGFTETARNFQVNNFGRGGTGNDSVLAEVQDGSGTNNANFATPPDGSRPRMQQFLFTATTPFRDSSLDADVVFHEYGHGISSRLIGNGSFAVSGIQSGAMGEGWSDYWAITINNDGAVGEYVTNNPTGIRRAVYSVPAAAVHDSYADLQVNPFGLSVHADGEVWAATLWDLRTQLGAATTDLLVLNGMKFTPNFPSFLNARDGVLQADQNLNGGANRCAIWTVFARHGMGVSAVGNDGTTHTAATDIPANCACSFSINPTSASFPAAGESASVTVTTIAGCNWTAASNNSFITITSGASGSGSGTVNYAVAENASSLSRSGSMTIAGLTFSVSQTGAPTRTLTVASSNPGSDVNITVSPSDNGGLGNGATPFNRTYNHNTAVSLSAPATVGINNFQKWQRNGVDFAFTPATSVTMDADYTLMAVHVTPTRTLTVASSNPATGVNIIVSPNDNSGLGNGATPFNRTYNHNTAVSLSAPATVGINNFQKWQRNGVDFAFTPATSVTMDADYTLTAVYVTPTRTLTVASSNPATGVNITGSPNDNSNQGSGATPFNRTYSLNTNVTLTAPATAGGNAFQKWQRNGVDFVFTQSTSVMMDANYTLTAVYVTPTRTLTVASSNPNSGVNITISPNDNSNQGSGATPFNRTYNLNTNVALTAPATAGGNAFQKWQRNGADWSTNRSTSVTIDGNHTMTAVYVTPTRTLTVGSSNPNSGVIITVSPNDNSNQGNGATPFNRTYNLNTIVTLAAPITAGGHTFHKWQRNGVDLSINPTINLTMNSNYTMTAVYGTRTLTISSNPNSGVSVTVSPNDANNQGSGTTGFSRIYNLNTIVSLTAPPTSGANIFQKWQRNGVDFSTIRSISVTMDTDYQLMAVYVSPPAPVQTLTVAITTPPDPPNPGVSITVSPNDNNNLGNGTTPFSRSYNHNTTVTLTAPSSLVSPFRKWQRNGLDWSTNRTTTVTMDSNYTMTAVYGVGVALRTLNVASTNPNSGVSVNLFPHDINNQGGGATQFSRTYNPNATVTLAAPATAGVSTFQKWQRNGVDYSTNRITDVTLDLFTTTMTAVYVGGGGNFTLGPSPALANPEGVNVNWTSLADHSTAYWIGLFRTGAPNNTWIDFQYVPAGGSLPFIAPTTPGNYEFWHLLNNSFTSSVTSNNFTVWSDCGNHSLRAALSQWTPEQLSPLTGPRPAITQSLI